MKIKSIFIIKQLSYSILLRILEKSKSFAITKVLKKEVNTFYKNIAVSKYSASFILKQTNMHFLLNVSVMKSSASLDTVFFENVKKKSDFNINNQKKIINSMKNVYILLIKKNGLIFNNFLAYKLTYFSYNILKTILHWNTSIILIKYFKLRLKKLI